MSAIAKNVSYLLVFPMYSSTTGQHITGITPTVTLSLDGAAFGASTNAAAEIGSTGIYKITLTAGEMNAVVVAFKATGTGALAASGTITTDEVKSVVDAVLDDTDDIGVAGAGLSAIPWNAAWDAEVQSEATDALVAYDPPTHAELISEIDSVQTDVAGVQADTDNIQTRLPAALVGGRMDSSVGAIANDAITAASIAANAIDDDALAADMDTYQAKVWLTDDDGGSTDRYVVAFFKNSQPYRTGGGITTPTIQVIKASDGSDLIAASALTEISTTEIYKYDATTTERITDGAAYAVIISATIDGSAREWVEVLNSRDSS